MGDLRQELRGLKLAIYFLTGVMALLAEALHTMSDIFVSGFLLMAAIWSRKEADSVHMFGYGYFDKFSICS